MASFPATTANTLRTTLESGEDFVLDRLGTYAREQGDTEYASSLREAWRMSVAGLTRSMLDALKSGGHVPELAHDKDDANAPWSAFARMEAERHRERGGTLVTFLSLVKYCQRSYDDLLLTRAMSAEDEEACKRFLRGFFDRVELAFVKEWTGTGENERRNVPEQANRRPANKKGKYLELFESVAAPSLLTGRDMRITGANRAARQLLGIGAIIGEGPYADRSSLECPRWLAVEIERFRHSGNGEWTFEYEQDGPNGRIRCFEVELAPILDVSGEFTGTSVVFREVSERRRAEEACRLSEERYRSLAETTPDWVWEMDADGRYTYCSPGAEALTGYRPEELLGREPFDFMEPDEAGRVRVLFEGFCEQRTAFEGLENTLRHKDGHEVVLVTNGVPISGANGELLGYRGIDHDITARKRYEESLEREQARLSVLQRLAESAMQEAPKTEVIAGAVRSLQSMFPEYRAVYAVIKDDGHMQIIVSEQPGMLPSLAGMSVDLNKAPAYLAALRAGRQLPVPDVSAEPLLGPLAKEMVAGQTAAVLDTPVPLEGRLVGVLCLDALTPTRWDEHAKRAAGSVADYLSLYLRQADARQERDSALARSEQSSAELAGLLDASRAVLEQHEFVPTAQSIFNSAKDLIGAAAGYVALLSETGEENEVLFLDAGGRECTVDPELPMPIRGLRSRAYEEARAVYDNQFAESEWMAFMPEGHVRLDNVLFAPLLLDGKPAGLLGLANKPGGFTERDASLAASFGELAALALRNSRLLESLEESESRYRQLFTEMVTGFALLEAEGGDMPGDYRLVDANPAFSAMIGQEAGAIRGRNLSELLPASYGRWHAALAQAIETRKPVHLRGAFTGPDRHYEVNAFKPEAGRIGVLFTDVTERHLAQARARRLSAAVEQAGEAVMVTDVDGSIVYVNPAWESLTGYRSEEAIGQNPRLLKSEQNEPALYTELWAALSAGRNWSNTALVNRRKGGSLYECACTISPVRDGSGEVTHFVSVAHDLTQQRELERRLRQAQKMEAIGTLAGGIAHDFNNILQVLLGYANLASGEVQAGTLAAQCIGEVIIAGQRAAGVVAQILAFSRQSEQVRQPLRLEPLLKETAKLLRGSIPSTLELKVEIEPDVGLVWGDTTEIHQVAINLCSNAYQAMHDQPGTLRIGLHGQTLETPVPTQTTVLEPGSYAVITVADTGPGMDDATMKRIFEPYFTTREKQGGTGLGLATVHGIVAGLGGGILVESTLGKGTVFKVYLPLLKPRQDEEDGPDKGNLFTEGPAPRGDGTRVLLVDDETQVAQLGQMALTALGYDVETAPGGPEAIERLGNGVPDFDVLVTDLAMPRMTGIDLAARAKKLLPDLPIILCTGYSENVQPAQLHSLGIEAVVLKPVVASELSAKIRDVLETSGKRQESTKTR